MRVPSRSEQHRGWEILAAQVVDVLELQHRARKLADALDEAELSNGLLAELAGRISREDILDFSTTGGGLRLAPLSLPSVV